MVFLDLPLEIPLAFSIHFGTAEIIVFVYLVGRSWQSNISIITALVCGSVGWNYFVV